jgi:predicted aldo/keto reductase-like oxidoreductase
MEYREIGKTRIQASIIDFGCEGISRVSTLEVGRLIGYAIDKGINIMD